MQHTNKNNYLASLVGDLGSNLFLYQILEKTPNGLLIVSNEHKILYANPAASGFLKYEYGQLTNASFPALIDEINPGIKGLSRLSVFFTKPHKSGAEYRFETEHLDEQGANQILDVAIEFPEAVQDYYLVYLVNITKRKLLEVELKRQNAFFHNLISSSVDGIISSDMQGNLILFNQGAQKLLGYSKKEALGSLHVSKLYPKGKAYEIIKKMRSDDFGGKGKLNRHKLNCVSKGGNQIPMSLSGGIIYENKKEIATYGIFTDLREIQKIEEDLEQTHQMLLQSEKMAGLGRLAAGIAHEINNPMSGIMLYANLIHEELGDAHELTDDIKTIMQEAERCKVIVADLLEFSHQTSYEMNEIDINEQINKTLGVLENQPLFHNITTTLNLDGNLAPALGNAIRLNQVIMNIIVNAAQAMKGNGEISITTRPRSDGNITELIITDTGPGIKEEIIGEIFDPFFTTKGAKEGTGLGLSVSYAIVKEHKGTIKVEPNRGKGASFIIRIPAVTTSMQAKQKETLA